MSDRLFSMRLILAAMLVVTTVGWAQEPATAPTLTAEEAVMVQAVMAVQKSAQAACEALPQVKDYTALLTKANAALKQAGKAVNWATGKPMVPQGEKP